MEKLTDKSAFFVITMAKKMDKAREFLVNEYIKSLSEGKIPWIKGWNGAFYRPQNGSSGKPYRGMNSLILSYVGDKKGYADPRWYTYKQAQDKGLQVRKGEKSAPISFPTLYLDGKYLSFDQYELLNLEDKNRVIWGRRAYSVFNAEQIDGVPELEKKNVADIRGSELVEDIRKGLGIGLEFRGNSAYYQPVKDKVIMPPKECFFSEEEYNATLLHELCHGTGHPSRLNRDLRGQFGSERYAREELRAEIGSSFLMQSLQLRVPDAHIDNHKAYIQSWIKVLNEEPQELFRAISEAENIEKYALEKGGIDIEKLAKESGVQDKSTAEKEKTAKPKDDRER